MRNISNTIRIENLEKKLEKLIDNLEFLTLSIEQPKDYIDYKLELFPIGRYKINRIAFIESINPYSGAFTTEEWDYMVTIQSKDYLTREEINKVEEIFKEVRSIVGYLR